MLLQTLVLYVLSKAGMYCFGSHACSVSENLAVSWHILHDKVCEQWAQAWGTLWMYIRPPCSTLPWKWRYPDTLKHHHTNWWQYSVTLKNGNSMSYTLPWCPKNSYFSSLTFIFHHLWTRDSKCSGIMFLVAMFLTCTHIENWCAGSARLPRHCCSNVSHDL